MKKILLKILGLWFVRILIGVFVIFIVLFFLEAANASSVIVSQYNTLYDNTIPQTSTLKSDFMDYAEVVSEIYDNSAQKRQINAEKFVNKANEIYDEITRNITFPLEYATDKGPIYGSQDEPLMALYFAQWFDKLKQAGESKYKSSYRPEDAEYNTYDFKASSYSEKCKKGNADQWCAIFASCIFSEAQIGVTRQVLPFNVNCMNQLRWFIENKAKVTFLVKDTNQPRYHEVMTRLKEDGSDAFRAACENALADERIKVDPEYTPKAGDIMYCVDHWDETGPYYASHVVIVLDYSEDKGLTTLEGNIGGPGDADHSQMKLKYPGGEDGQYKLGDRVCIFVTPNW